ncbi:MAG: AhpC/TSA family protein [Bacteroidales bacterium]|nr:AhpC/TSA family protein [Bacteroidales bacterium]
MAQPYRSASQAQGLRVGEKAPNFQATDSHGNQFKLESALKEGPVVVVFYRGHWCPVCNKHLKKLQDSLEVIQQAGARVVAISPEKPDNLEKTAEKTGTRFSLLYDEGYRISDAFDVTFRPDSMDRIMYNTILRANLKNAHSDDSQQLPVPATFVIGRDGKIAWRHFDPDYKKRASAREIMEALTGLN